MQQEKAQMALIRAAKYICTKQCGNCPMVLEDFPCPKECGLETLPWKCWLEFFKRPKSEAEIISSIKGEG